MIMVAQVQRCSVNDNQYAMTCTEGASIRAAPCLRTNAFCHVTGSPAVFGTSIHALVVEFI